MFHRIFLAINLPSDVKQILGSFKEKWKELPARWVKEENLHITLIFFGYLKDSTISKISEVVRDVVHLYRPFDVILQKIIYAPPRVRPPHMIWVLPKERDRLRELYENISRPLLKLNIKCAENEFVPHITLARIRKMEFRLMDDEERPMIDEEINLRFEVRGVELMESHLKREGPQYITLERFDFLQS